MGVSLFFPAASGCVSRIARAPLVALVAVLSTAAPAVLVAQMGDDPEADAQRQRMQERIDALEERLDAGHAPFMRHDLYGSVRAGLGLLSDGDGRGANVFDNDSRIGLRGSLVPGVAADGRDPEVFWQVESGLALDEGAGSLSARNSFLGLRGAWGSLRLGFFDSPGKEVGRAAEQVNSRVGDQRNLTRVDDPGGGWDERTPGWDNRFGNAIAYATPTLAGVTVSVLVSTNFDDDFGNTTDTTPALSTSVTYQRGPLWAGASFETIDKDFDGLEANDDNPRQFRLATVYTIGDLILSGLFQRSLDQQGVSGQDRTVFGGGASYWLWESLRLGGHVYRAEADDSLRDSGATMIAGELEYRIYSQTRLYFSVAHTENDRNARFQTARGLINDGEPGDNSTSGSVLLRHDF